MLNAECRLLLLTFLSIALLAFSGYSRKRSLTFMAKLFDLPRYIAVEGPIRVGKTTLSNILAERLNAQRVTDPENNTKASRAQRFRRNSVIWCGDSSSFVISI